MRESTGAAARTASTGIDFAEAVASLGVDRGVTSFVRYALLKRRGDSYLALPAGRIEVRYRAEVDIVRELDRELEIFDGFLRRFPGGPPARLVSARRNIDEARFDVALHGGPTAMTRLLRSIGAIEQVLARRNPTAEPSLWRPLGNLSPAWLEKCGDDAEVRIAASLVADPWPRGIPPLRAYLAPIDPEDPKTYARRARPIPYVGADVADRLASVLHRRALDAATSSLEVRLNALKPDRMPARLEDIGELIADTLDDIKLEQLIFGMTWIRLATARPPVGKTSGVPAPPLSRGYALLKLCFLSRPLRADIVIRPETSIVPLLRAGRVGEAVRIASRRLSGSGLRPRTVVPTSLVDPALGRRIAAALLVPVRDVNALERSALITTAADNPEADY